MSKLYKRIKNSILVASALMTLAGSVNAQSAVNNFQFPKLSDTYSDSLMASSNCDKAVMEKMFYNAEQKFNAIKKPLDKILVRDQMEATPKKATNEQLRCLDGAFNTILGFTKTADALVKLLSGQADWGAGAKSIVNQMTANACNQLDNYMTGQIYSATSPFNSTISSTTSVLTGGVNVNTGGIGGNVQVGAGVMNPTGGFQPPTKICTPPAC